jgi:hypothetical protein
VSLTDVRVASDGTDLARDLDVTLPVRMTDTYNGDAGITPATVADFTYYNNPYRAAIPCSTTADPAIGSTCALQTTFDALVPPYIGGGLVGSGTRAIWQLDQIALYDGGEDGYVTSRDDNTVLAVQGLFVP